MFNLMFLFVAKLLDTYLSALKNVLMIKNKHFFSALATTGAYLFYLLMMDKLMSDSNVITISITLLAVFLGQYLAPFLCNKFDKDQIWKINVVPESKELGKSLADKLRDNNIAVQTYIAYNSKKEQTLGINAFAETKVQSTIINNILKEEQKEISISISEIRNRF